MYIFNLMILLLCGGIFFGLLYYTIKKAVYNALQEYFQHKENEEQNNH